MAEVVFKKTIRDIFIVQIAACGSSVWSTGKHTGERASLMLCDVGMCYMLNGKAQQQQGMGLHFP